ncbi:hypothetical protein V498_06444 [Pseudogymnoascus sp. VKM F-4517 (FW-2822)]|nr:hypothetical protein V498_06444 [Pseudogymnoascus sp. VKM F-4517 (FW-2822)]
MGCPAPSLLRGVDTEVESARVRSVEMAWVTAWLGGGCIRGVPDSAHGEDPSKPETERVRTPLIDILGTASLGLPFCASTPPKSHSSPSPSHSVAHYWSFAEGGSPETGVHDQRPLHHTQRPHTHNLSTRSSSLSTSTSLLPPLSLLSPPSSPLSLVVLFPWAEIGRLPFATPGSPGCKGSRRDSVGAFLYNLL